MAEIVPDISQIWRIGKPSAQEGARRQDDATAGRMPAMTLVNDILGFWFGAPGTATHGTFREIWFRKDAQFDESIRRHFLGAVDEAAQGKLDGLVGDAEGALALMLLLDQFPRNLFRGTARAFAADPKARQIADAALARGFDQMRSTIERTFFYLPFEHSENLADQERSVELYRRLAQDEPSREDALDYAVRHLDIIKRFGRFPHRNQALGRESTEDEVDFLKQPNSSF
jgi:uncharacterized protein (DUF924 family)